jgi:hypothetical protein
MPKISKKLMELMEILACPKCKGDLELDEKNRKIICHSCRLRFKILPGDIPDMLIEDAEKF